MVKKYDMGWIWSIKRKINKIRIYTENSYYEFTNSLKEIKDKLDSNFFQIHKSCIVNLEKVHDFDKKEKCYV